MLKRITLLSILIACSTFSFSQKENTANDAEASNLLKKTSEKYKSYKNIAAEFKLVIQRPKMKSEEDDKKYTDTIKGKIYLQGAKFNIDVKGQKVICDGKNMWTYSAADREVQVNYYEESNDIFSPSKIFSLYNSGYSYQIKEKKTVNGKAVTVVEMSPVNKKVSYFKIDVSIDDATGTITETKVYEKNGVRYIYKLTKQTPDSSLTDDLFTFDPKKYPGVKGVDLR